MEAQGLKKETYSNFAVPVLMGKGLGSIRNSMIRFGNNHLEWKFDDMIKALGKELDVLEGHFPIMQYSGGSKQETLASRPRQQEGTVDDLSTFCWPGK